MSIQNNTTALQALLEQANALPDAGSGTDERFLQLASGTLPAVNDDTLTKVKDSAFAYDTTLKTARLSNLKSMSSSCFRGCTNLETVDLPNVTGAIAPYGFQSCSNLKNVNIPLATSVGLYAFRECKVLEKLELGNISSINGYSFGSCAKLITLIIRRTGTKVSTLSSTSAFNGTPIASGTGFVYVPSALVDTYKTATNWSTFADQIRAIEDYPEITGG